MHKIFMHSVAGLLTVLVSPAFANSGANQYNGGTGNSQYNGGTGSSQYNTTPDAKLPPTTKTDIDPNPSIVPGAKPTSTILTTNSNHVITSEEQLAKAKAGTPAASAKDPASP